MVASKDSSAVSVHGECLSEDEELLTEVVNPPVSKGTTESFAV